MIAAALDAARLLIGLAVGYAVARTFTNTDTPTKEIR